MQSPQSHRSPLSPLLFAAACTLTAACAGGNGGGTADFESDWLDEGGVGRDLSGGVADASGDGDGAGNTAQRTLEEADIVQQLDGRLYALSRYSGLNIIDVADPTNLVHLGGYRSTRGATPFEMYIRDGVALVMFSGWGMYARVQDGDGYAWVTTSEVLALDVRDPEDVQVLGSFEVPGELSDSRVVGDVLYVVGYQNGSCYACAQDTPQTSIVSLDISNPRAIAKVDELNYGDDTNTWGWERRSVTVNDQRMYVAGPEYGDQGPQGSSIQVVDISDPAGAMVEGAVVQVEGEVSSRWQMSEYEGVLRVISQPPGWNLQAPPVIQTFTVTASDDVTPLGRTDMVLPRPEQLQSVRFDGERAYAITFERTDPLFTIDLSDPALPVQAGELEIPGFVYHMEPRGERVLGLGFDQGNPAGGITVSLFDVSDMAAPAMLDRVNFGGDWGSLPEDQDRIHKVFRVLDTLGLILVPHSGEFDRSINGDGDADADPCAGGPEGSYRSGVQLVDFTDTTLQLQGAVTTRGEARRALIVGEHLLAVSDQQIDAFSITDRSAPVQVGGVSVARNVNHAIELGGGRVARVSQDWWDDFGTLDLVDLVDVGIPASGLGEIRLTELLDEGEACNRYVWPRELFARGDDQLVVVYDAQGRFEADQDRAYYGVAVIDVADPAAPTLVGKHTWSEQDTGLGSSGYFFGLPVPSTSIVQVGDAIVMHQYRYIRDGGGGSNAHELLVVDLSDPSEPTPRVIPMPQSDTYGGLLVNGTQVATSHHEAVEDRPGVVRFYLDRYDVSDPGKPAALPKVSISGALMTYDGEHALTVRLTRQPTEELSVEKCGDAYALHEYAYDTSDGDSTTGTCHGYTQSVDLMRLQGERATREGSYDVEPERTLTHMALGDDVAFATLGSGVSYYGGLLIDCFDCGGGFYYGQAAADPQQLLVLSGMAQDSLRVASLELDVADAWYGWWGSPQLVASGTRAVAMGRSELAVVDASDAQTPVIERTQELMGDVQGVSLRGDRLLLSLGMAGCQVVDL